MHKFLLPVLLVLGSLSVIAEESQPTEPSSFEVAVEQSADQPSPGLEGVGGEPIVESTDKLDRLLAAISKWWDGDDKVESVEVKEETTVEAE